MIRYAALPATTRLFPYVTQLSFLLFNAEDLTEDRRRVGEASHALSSGHLASNSQLDVKFKEPKPVLKMPTIFQTEKMKSLRTSQIQTR